MTEEEIRLVCDRVKQREPLLKDILDGIGKVIVGQEYLIDRLLTALFANGHILIEGVPGLAKTTTVKALSATIDAKFQRIQFTPDLLPSDLVGTLVYDPRNGNFSVKKGPIFANIVLADEINRAPAKVQSALLEAMQEKQVTIGENTFKLDRLFMVLATQNPIEQEGTYPLPEAQLDRFMLKINISYPSMEEEREVLKKMAFTSHVMEAVSMVHPDDIIKAREIVDEIYLDKKIEQYILDLVFASRFPDRYKLDDLAPLIRYGASPRATMYLAVAAKAYAFIHGRGYVTPHDIKSVGPDVLRHRIITSYTAAAEEVTSDEIVRRIFDGIEVP